jgi:hypothetical protein
VVPGPHQPWAVKSLSADIHLNVLNNSYDRIYLCAHIQWRCAHSVEMRT